MKGFFFDPEKKAEKQARTPIDKASTSSRLSARAKPKGLLRVDGDPCETCGLFSSVNSPKLGVTGQGKLGILYLGKHKVVKRIKTVSSLLGMLDKS
jgi:hypothetical protein